MYPRVVRRMRARFALGGVVVLCVLLMVGALMIKLAILRTAFALGGSLAMFGLLAILIAAAVVMFSLRSRRARY